MVKGPRLAHASPKKTIALGSDFGDTPTKSSSSVCSSNPAIKINQKLNVVDDQQQQSCEGNS